jgi:hypothetical protein
LIEIPGYTVLPFSATMRGEQTVALYLALTAPTTPKAKIVFYVRQRINYCNHYSCEFLFSATSHPVTACASTVYYYYYYYYMIIIITIIITLMQDI